METIAERRSGAMVTGDDHDVVVRTADGRRIRRRSFLVRHPERLPEPGAGPAGRRLMRSAGATSALEASPG